VELRNGINEPHFLRSCRLCFLLRLEDRESSCCVRYSPFRRQGLPRRDIVGYGDQERNPNFLELRHRCRHVCRLRRFELHDVTRTGFMVFKRVPCPLLRRFDVGGSDLLPLTILPVAGTKRDVFPPTYGFDLADDRRGLASNGNDVSLWTDLRFLRCFGCFHKFSGGKMGEIVKKRVFKHTQQSKSEGVQVPPRAPFFLTAFPSETLCL